MEKNILLVEPARALSSATMARLLPLLAVAQARMAAAPPPHAACSLANGTEYRAASLQTTPAPTAARCCALCEAVSGCAYFTHFANETCALKATFGEPVLTPGAVSGATAAGPAPADYAHHDDPQLLAALAALPPLPKPHYSWPVMPTGTMPEYTKDAYFLQVARICGSVSFSAEFARARPPLPTPNPPPQPTNRRLTDRRRRARSRVRPCPSLRGRQRHQARDPLLGHVEAHLPTRRAAQQPPQRDAG